MENILDGRASEFALYTCVKECLITKIASSKFNENMWLREYHTQNSKRLVYVYHEEESVLLQDGFVPGQHLSQNFREQFLQYICVLAAPELKIHGEVVGEEILLSVQMEEKYLPLQLTLQAIHQNLSFAVRKKYVPQVYDGIKESMILAYPLEEEGAQHLYLILKKMELLNEMEHYHLLYLLLSQESMEGTRVCIHLRKECERGNIRFQGSRWEKILSYKTNTKMKHKWDKYKKRQNVMSLEWENVIDGINSFATPIWNSLIKDEIFFGDWMPQLQRFLD